MAAEFIACAQRVLKIEQQAIEQLAQYLNADFEQACEIMLSVFESKKKHVHLDLRRPLVLQQH